MLVSLLKTTWGLLAAIAFFAGSVAYRRRAGQKRPESASGDSPGGILITDFLRDWYGWLVDPIERKGIEMGVSPATLTWAGLAFHLLAGLDMASGNTGQAAVAIGIGTACTYIGSRIAARREEASRGSVALGTVLDRYVDLSHHLGLIWLFANDRVLSALVLLSAGGALLLSHAPAAVDIARGAHTPVFSQRSERLFLLFLACALTPLETGIVGLAGLPARHYLLSGTVFFLAAASQLAAAEAFSRSLRAPNATEPSPVG